MSTEDRDIDALLRRNVERQLDDFDWEGLSRGIHGRLAAAGARSGSWNQYGRWLAMAAGIALTAGVLILAMIAATGRGPTGSTPGEAKVTMTESAHPAGTAQVSFARMERPVRCEVTIHASDTPRQESRARASWCIVARQERSVEKYRNDRDASDVLYLF
jgi:hypothetical protein